MTSRKKKERKEKNAKSAQSYLQDVLTFPQNGFDIIRIDAELHAAQSLLLLVQGRHSLRAKS
jgi:hypothetical protein